MEATRRNGRFPMLWLLVCVLMTVGLTAWLQAQPKPESAPPGTQPATTQPRAAVPQPRTGEQSTQPSAEDKTRNQTIPAPDTATGHARKENPRAGATTRQADPEPKREPTPTEILRELTKQANPPRPVVPPITPGSTDRRTVSSAALPPNAIRPPTAKLLPDGYRLVDRPGRLVRDGDYWVYSIEDRAQGDPEMPVRLLPNRLLEDMERFSAGGTKPVVFVVSGEMTEYHNVNYLLVQKLLTRPELGNLK
jgi:hypothetical protein